MMKDYTNKRKIYIAILFILLLVYLCLDYLNIPTLLGLTFSKINMDLFSLIVNSFVVVLLFVITYYKVEKNQRDKERNSKRTADILMCNACKDCLKTLTTISNKEMVEKYIIPKIDGDKTVSESKLMTNMQKQPFEAFENIMSLANSGFIDDEKLKAFLSLKRDFQSFVPMKITFYDADKAVTDEQIALMNELTSNYYNLTSNLESFIKQLG